MDLARKLQIKPGTLVSVVAAPADGPDLSADGGLQLTDSPAEAGAVIAFARQRADLAAAGPAIEAAREDRLAAKPATLSFEQAAISSTPITVIQRRSCRISILQPGFAR